MSYTFTDSKINPSALKQDKHWYDRKGKEYEISKMSRQHLIGAMGKLFQAFGSEVTTTPLYLEMMKKVGSR